MTAASGPVAILCSGQGGQHRDMFRLLADEPDASPVFAAATPFLGGTDPRRFVRDADEDALFANRAGQVLCCVQALAADAALRPRRPARIVIAGYSVGELAAWGCAGLLSPDAVLALAAERATLMDAASPEAAGLAAVGGLPAASLARLLATHGAHLAIDNGRDGAVIGGDDDALARCLADARAAGATTATRLRVAVPSHTRLLAPAASAFAGVLRDASFGRPDPGVRLLSGVDGDAVRDVAAGARKLAAQIGDTVRWARCVEACVEAGASAFLELGPGAALTRMIERALIDVPARALEQFRTVSGVGDWLARR